MLSSLLCIGNNKHSEIDNFLGHRIINLSEQSLYLWIKIVFSKKNDTMLKFFYIFIYLGIFFYI